MKRYLRAATALLFVFIITVSALLTTPYGLTGDGEGSAGTGTYGENGAGTADASAPVRAEQEETEDGFLDRRLYCTVLGDSIAKGYSDDKSVQIACYGELAAREIAAEKQEPFTVRNYARNGLASKGMNEKILTQRQVLMDLEKSNLILITIGSNDLLNECKRAVQEILKTDAKFKSADEALSVLEDAVKSNPFLIIRIIDAISNWDYQSFEAQWMQMMETVNSVRRDTTQVIVTDIYNPVVNMELPSTMNQVVEDIIGNMNSIIEKHAGTYGYSVARVSESTICAHVQSDGLHPDQMGQQIIAELVTEQYRAERE